MVHFTADTHFNHQAAIAFPGRNFSTLEEMHKSIIENWNCCIADTDTVYILGDYYFGTSAKEMHDITVALKGNKILLKGNHDTMPPSTYIKCGFSKYYDVPILIGGDLLLSHEPVIHITGDGLYNIHGHTHGREFALQSSKHFCVATECTNLRPVSYKEINKRKFLEGGF